MLGPDRVDGAVRDGELGQIESIANSSVVVVAAIRGGVVQRGTVSGSRIVWLKRRQIGDLKRRRIVVRFVVQPREGAPVRQPDIGRGSTTEIRLSGVAANAKSHVCDSLMRGCKAALLKSVPEPSPKQWDLR